MIIILLTPSLEVNMPDDQLLSEKIMPWKYQDILESDMLDSLDAKALPPEYKDMIYYDGMVEGDSLRLLNAVINSKTDYPAEFWPVMILWLRDEANHRDGFRAIYKALYTDMEQRDRVADNEKSDFSSLQEILHNPLSLLLALSIDELQTIIAYKNDLRKYQEIHERVRDFTARVIADEGWHLQKFLNLAARYCQDASNDNINSAWKSVMQAKGNPYKRTFAFDQGDRQGAKRIDNDSEELVKARVWTLLQKRLNRTMEYPTD